MGLRPGLKRIFAERPWWTPYKHPLFGWILYIDNIPYPGVYSIAVLHDGSSFNFTLAWLMPKGLTNIHVGRRTEWIASLASAADEAEYYIPPIQLMALKLGALSHKGKTNPDYTPTRQRTFTPSYTAKTREDYFKRVKNGSKRLNHTQLVGGRRLVRHPNLDQKKMTVATKERLARQLPPWDKRTQSPNAIPETLEDKISKAIERYQEGALEFLVPDTPTPLIGAGMPKKAAKILVQRAAGKIISDTAFDAFNPTTLLGAFAQSLGNVWLSYTEISTDQGPIERIEVSQGDRKVVLLTAKQMERRVVNAHKSKNEKGIRWRDEFDSDLLIATFEELQKKIRQAESLWHTRSVQIIVTLGYEKGKVNFAFSTREHSKSAQERAKDEKIQYRTLENITLSELPTLLARLSRRKKKVQRKLPPL